MQFHKCHLRACHNSVRHTKILGPAVQHFGCSYSVVCKPELQLNDSTSRKVLRRSLTSEQSHYLSAALRVNQTGELGAVLIYAAQIPIVVGRNPKLRGLMKHMYDQEVGHLDTFDKLIAKHRVRPSVMYPLWQVLATGLGWTTAMMGTEAAMACTEAVETEIGGHYNEQVRELMQITGKWEVEGHEVGPELTELIQTLRRIRDEELEHLDLAVEHDAKKAPLHNILTGFVRLSCRGAIWVSERV